MTWLEWFREEKVAVNCETSGQEMELLQRLEEEGAQWNVGIKPTDEHCWHTFERDTCIDLAEDGLTYDDRAYYRQIGYTIIPWELFKLLIEGG